MLEIFVVPIFGAVIAALVTTVINWMCIDKSLAENNPTAKLPSKKALVKSWEVSKSGTDQLIAALSIQSFLDTCNAEYRLTEHRINRDIPVFVRLIPAVIFWIAVTRIFDGSPWWIYFTYCSCCIVLSVWLYRDTKKKRTSGMRYEECSISDDAAFSDMMQYLKSLYGEHGEAYLVSKWARDNIEPNTMLNIVKCIRAFFISIWIFGFISKYL